MKRLLLFALLLLPLCGWAQSSSVGAFFDRYLAAEGFTSVQLERRMMRLMSRQAADRGDAELARLLGEIEYIRVVALRDGDGEAFVRAASDAVAADSRFQPLTSVSEEGQTTRFFLRTPALSSRSELVMITRGDKETVVVDIYGAFDLRQVVRLSSIRPQ